VGILQAMQLRDTLRKRLKTAGGSAAARRAALAGLPAEFHQQLPAVLDFPWTLATGASTEPPSATKQCPEALPLVTLAGHTHRVYYGQHTTSTGCFSACSRLAAG